MKTASKYSLRTWVLLLALTPTILLGVLLGGYFTYQRFSELSAHLEQQGLNIIKPLAIAAEYDLLNQKQNYTQHLVDRLQRQNAGLVRSIFVFDNKNRLIASSTPLRSFEPLRTVDQLLLSQGTLIEREGDLLLFYTPITTISSLPNRAPVQLGYIAMQINEHEATLAQYRIAITAFIIFLIGIQLNLLFTFRLLKSVPLPINKMVKALAKIREGHLDQRIEGELIGELEELRRGINDMATSLANSHEEMQHSIDQATSDLQSTLEQIEIQNVELDLAKKKALEASRIKSEFLANMSHELRTPLNGVLGFTRQLQKTPLHDNQRSYLRTIELSARNLLSLINDILDFSKLEAGKMMLDSVPFSLRDALDDTLMLISPNAYEKGLELIVDIDEAISDNLCGDVMRIQQIMTNLLGNAIKFTKQGHIALSMKLIDADEDHVQIRTQIVDTGIGIDKSHQALLFQPFGQADSSVSRRFGGTGLGLVITKRLVSQMQGQIGFKSTQGQGSTFWFTLHIDKSSLSAQPLRPNPLLSDSHVLLFEPRPLSQQQLCSQFAEWGMHCHGAHDLATLAAQLDAQPQLDYLLLSAHAIAQFDDIAALWPALCTSVKKVVLTHELDPPPWAQQLAEQGQLELLALPLSSRRLCDSLLLNEKTPHKAAYTEPALPLSASPASELPSSEWTPNTELLPLTVLAVDDNPANLKLISTLLREFVQQVDCASDGHQAIELCQQRHYDAIFMDIQMPELDGLSATLQIRQQGRSQHSPVIAVTAHAMDDEREQILASGMDDYLTKPIDEKDLRQMLLRWVHTSALSGANVVDWSMVLTQVGGNTELAKEMLSMLVESIPATLAQLDSAADDHQFIQIVHKLHGATCYCGVPALQKLCAQIEVALKQGVSSDSLEPELLELRDELNKVESAAKAILAA